MKTLTAKQYENLGPDQKGERFGQPYALYLDPGKGTVYGPVTLLDERDQAILETRQAAFRARTNGPQVGHYVRFADGTLRRISHVWDFEEGYDKIHVQTSDGGSFYLSESGAMSFSGGLHPTIPAYTLRPTGDVKMGSCWFFRHALREAHNGINVEVPCDVWRCRLEAN